MRRLLDVFAYDRGLVNDELAALRYQASIRPGMQEAFASMFPAPRQQGVDALAAYQDRIPTIRARTLVIHGREDRVVPLATSLRRAGATGRRAAARVRALRPLDADRAHGELQSAGAGLPDGALSGQRRRPGRPLERARSVVMTGRERGAGSGGAGLAASPVAGGRPGSLYEPSGQGHHRLARRIPPHDDELLLNLGRCETRA